MRTLFYVPTLHTVYETLTEYSETVHGPLPPDIAKDHIKILKTWGRIWKNLEDLITSGTLIPKQLHIFGDGIPLRPGSLLVTHLERSPTLQCMDRLIKLGARRHGTEKRELLLAHGLHIMKSRGRTKTSDDIRFTQFIMRARDTFIARRMLACVPQHQDGILFMGLQHAVDRHIAQMSPQTRIYRSRHFAETRRTLESLNRRDL